MKIGKIPENVLKRSVLKQIKPNSSNTLKGTEIGSDCAFFHMGSEVSVIANASGNNEGIWAAAHGIYRATNNVAAGGGTPKAVTLHLMLPQSFEEADLKEMMKQAKIAADKVQVDITSGHTETLAGLTDAVASVCAMGTPVEAKKELAVHSGQHIVMTKWMGIAGTINLANAKKNELREKYPAYLIEDAKDLEQYYSVIPEAALAMEFGVCAMHDVAGGGIFSALWELGESADVGLSVELKKIPVKQETIEICEYFDVNPYELRSDGALLMIVEDGYTLCDKLSQINIPATVIGTITDNHDRVVVNDGEKRFLEPSRKDSLNLIL